jgi:large subunit ribosomal protein L33
VAENLSNLFIQRLIMAKKGRTLIELRSSESKHWRNTTKNPKTTTGKIKKKMYDPTLQKHVMYEEGKIRK